MVLAGILEENGVQLIRDKVAALGPNDGAVKLLAFDGFAQQATIDNTGPDAKGMYVSLPGKVPGALTGAGDVFVKELKAQIGEQPVEVFAPYAGQAAGVLIEAIRLGSTRAGTISELFKTKIEDGITGSFTITAHRRSRPRADQRAAGGRHLRARRDDHTAAAARLRAARGRLRRRRRR